MGIVSIRTRLADFIQQVVNATIDTKTPKYLESISQVSTFLEYCVCHGIEEKIVRKIAFQNAVQFFKRYEQNK